MVYTSDKDGCCVLKVLLLMHGAAVRRWKDFFENHLTALQLSENTHKGHSQKVGLRSRFQNMVYKVSQE
jgi:hypothetical protein